MHERADRDREGNQLSLDIRVGWWTRIVASDRDVSVSSADWNRSEKEKENGAELPIDVGGRREAAVLARWVKIELHSDLIDAARLPFHEKQRGELEWKKKKRKIRRKTAALIAERSFGSGNERANA